MSLDMRSGACRATCNDSQGASVTKRVIGGCVMAVFLGAALPATAQTPAKPATGAAKTPASASDNLLAISGIAGIAAVQNVSGMFGGEIDVRLSPKLDVMGEGVMMQDLITRQRLKTATQLAAYLTSSQGKTATGVVKAPGGYGGGGVRFVVKDTGQLQIYALGTVGMAR